MSNSQYDDDRALAFTKNKGVANNFYLLTGKIWLDTGTVFLNVIHFPAEIKDPKLRKALFKEFATPESFERAQIMLSDTHAAADKAAASDALKKIRDDLLAKYSSDEAAALVPSRVTHSIAKQAFLSLIQEALKTPDLPKNVFDNVPYPARDSYPHKRDHLPLQIKNCKYRIQMNRASLSEAFEIFHKKPNAFYA